MSGSEEHEVGGTDEDVGAPSGDGGASILERIRVEAKALGFDALYCVSAAEAVTDRDRDRLAAFLANGEHGTMTWMERHPDRRGDPQVLWSAVRSILVLGSNYGPAEDPLQNLERPAVANISVYSRNEDYHDLVKKRLKRLGRWMAAEFGCELKVFVDTAPVLEKGIAGRSGIGWQGKHTCVVSRDFGSWLFLSEIYTTLELPPDEPVRDFCGTCTRCQDICPTKAFPRPYTLDARRCLSYLTIEHAGPIPHEFRKPMGNRVYGCDDCLAVCPWNRFAKATAERAFVAREELTAPLLAEFLGMDDATFRTHFRKSPIKRSGRERFLRNCLVAIGNAAAAGAVGASEVEAVKRLLDDPSPVLRGAAVWALAQALDAEGFGELRAARLPDELDEDVRAEWALGDESIRCQGGRC